MDGQRFDALTRALAAAPSRRRLFKGAALALGALVPINRARVAFANATCGVACDDNGACNSSDDNCYSCCGGACVDVGSDPNNCGACGQVCPGGPYAVCVNAVCSLQCPAGFTACDDGGSCADLANDPLNCLACGNACAGGQACCGDAGCIDLTSDLHSCGACGNDCGDGGRCCGSACVDPNSDAGNCGDCGVACAAEQRCQRGVCAARCSADQLFCAPDCVDAQNDPANCGGCGNACAGAQRCQGGACVSSCADGASDCGGSCADLANDPANCGACGNVCPRDTTCVNGTCNRPPCPTGQTHCQDGCFDIKTDANHCGGCANVCLNSDFACCDGGCFDLKTDPNHCGRCDFACPPGYVCDGKGCLLQGSADGVTGAAWRASPDFCVTNGRAKAEIDALFLAPGSATPAPTPAWAAIATGAKVKVEPASAELAQTITNTVVQVSACGSANDPARQTALMTDAMASGWLAERGVTADQWATIDQAAPAALPPQSWEQIAAIDHVFTVGSDLVSALVAFAPLAPSLPPRVETHLFKQQHDQWRLDAIRREDAFSAKSGSLLLRLFDCPAGVSAHDPAAACAPTPELRFDYELVSAGGKLRKRRADAQFLAAGLLLWTDLTPGVVELEPLVPSDAGIHVTAGTGLNAHGKIVVPIVAGASPAVIDLYHEGSLIADAISRARLDDASCPPCSRKDPARGICAPTCPPCSACRTAKLGGGGTHSSCQSICRDDQVCQVDGGVAGKAACCAPEGGACAANADCCDGACMAGVCGCGSDGDACRDQAGCCPGAACDEASQTCHACKTNGAACSASAECCGHACFKGSCGCCAPVPKDDFEAAGLCCTAPHAFLKVEENARGKGFARCCLPGVDCVGDPLGPAVAEARFTLAWAPAQCA